MIVMVFVSVQVEMHADALDPLESQEWIEINDPLELQEWIEINDLLEPQEWIEINDPLEPQEWIEIDDPLEPYESLDPLESLEPHEAHEPLEIFEPINELLIIEYDGDVIDNYNSERMHQRFIYGFPDGTVRPDASVTRAEAATIVFRLLEEDNKFYPTPLYFSDVGHDSWYSQAVNYLAHVGILLGYSDGTFKANDMISRAEFSAIIARFTNSVSDAHFNFSDVNGEHWATPYISAVAENGWVLGYTDGTFRPENQVSRAEFIVIMNRILDRNTSPDTIRENLGGNTTTVFSDISTMHWAFYDIMEASITHSYVINQYGREEWLRLYLPTVLAH